MAGRLRTWLWGHLEIGLLRPGEALIELTGDDLIHARQILDLWLAVTPPLPSGWPEHYAGKIRSFFDGALSILNGRKDQCLDQATFHLFTLLYRGLLKLDPEYAGLRYPTLCRLAHESRAGCQGDLAGPVLGVRRPLGCAEIALAFCPGID